MEGRRFAALIALGPRISRAFRFDRSCAAPVCGRDPLEGKPRMAVPNRPTAVVFDIGNVLLRWDPRNLYRKIFRDEARMEWFLREVCSHDWNLEQDRGRSFAEAVEKLLPRHPEWAAEIRAFDERWQEMVPGAIEENVTLLRRLEAAGVPLYAITNFSREKFAEARERFPFLGGFDGVIVSAHEGLVKPDPAIYRLLIDRYGLAAEDCVFIDDSAANAEGARQAGMRVVHYVEPMDLAAELRRIGLPA
jgi:2-haloacid dehalogenase